MIDLAEIWAWLRSERGQAEGAALTLPDVITRNSEIFEDFVLPARIQIEQDECLGPMFEFHPRPDVASPKSWAWVIAVRGGAIMDIVRQKEAALSPQSWWRTQNRQAELEALEFATGTLHAIALSGKWPAELSGTERLICSKWTAHNKRLVDGGYEPFDVSFLISPMPESFAADTGAERGEAFSKAREMLRRWHDDISAAATMECLLGREIYELVAVSANFSKILGRFLGYWPVIGYPLRPEAEERPVRLFRDLKSYISGFCGGALLIGTPDENYRWLAACDGGIVTDDVAHGKAVKKILTRPYTGPKVFVAA